MQISTETVVIITILFLFLAILNFFNLNYIARNTSVTLNSTNSGAGIATQFIVKVKANSKTTKQVLIYKGDCLESSKAILITDLSGKTGSVNLTIQQNKYKYIENTEVFEGSEVPYAIAGGEFTTNISKASLQLKSNHTVGCTFTNSYPVDVVFYFTLKQQTADSLLT
jgi:hypothetical protein